MYIYLIVIIIKYYEFLKKEKISKKLKKGNHLIMNLKNRKINKKIKKGNQTILKTLLKVERFLDSPWELYIANSIVSNE